MGEHIRELEATKEQLRKDREPRQVRPPPFQDMASLSPPWLCVIAGKCLRPSKAQMKKTFNCAVVRLE